MLLENKIDELKSKYNIHVDFDGEYNRYLGQDYLNNPEMIEKAHPLKHPSDISLWGGNRKQNDLSVKDFFLVVQPKEGEFYSQRLATVFPSTTNYQKDLFGIIVHYLELNASQQKPEIKVSLPSSLRSKEFNEYKQETFPRVFANSEELMKYLTMPV